MKGMEKNKLKKVISEKGKVKTGKRRRKSKKNQFIKRKKLRELNNSLIKISQNSSDRNKYYDKKLSIISIERGNILLFLKINK
jgi:hypothetical protein